MSLLPPCRCGGSWLIIQPNSTLVVICENCHNLAHPLIAAQVLKAAG